MIEFIILFGWLFLLMTVGAVSEWWTERRRFLDPENYNQRVLEWASTKTLEDLPAQLNWEEFEGYVDRALDQHQNPWGKIDIDKILYDMQKLANEDFRRRRRLEEDSLEDEPFYRDDSPPESQTWTPPCPHCSGPTELTFPIGIGKIINTPTGPRVAAGVEIRCEICRWHGPSRDSYFNAGCMHVWERFLVDGSSAVRYVCSECGYSRDTKPHIMVAELDPKRSINPFKKSKMIYY